MKIDLQTNREHILSLHKKNKTEKMILREQAGDIYAKLKSMVDKGQVPDAVSIAELKTTNPDRKYAIKKKSVKYKGKYVYLFHDFKWGMYDDNDKFFYGEGLWEPKPPKPTVDDKFKQAEIESFKTKYGAKTKEEAISSGWDFGNLNKETVHGVELFWPKSRQDVVVGVSDEQKGALAAYKARYEAKEWDELTPAEKALDWKELDVPDSKKLFGRDVKLFVKKSNRLKVSDSPYEDFRKEYDMTEKECAEKVMEYFDDYRTGRPMGKDYFVNEKPKVQFCKNKYHNRWGVRLNSNKLNKILDLMSRQINEFQGAKLPPSIAQPGSDKHLWLIENQ